MFHRFSLLDRCLLGDSRATVRRLGRDTRFFHSHHRPTVQPVNGSIHLKSPRNVLWSYATAPSNLLFLTSNLIGLGIITMYRGLSTVANTDLEDLKMVVDIGSTGTNDDPNWEYDGLKLLQNSQAYESSILDEVDRGVFQTETSTLENYDHDMDPFIPIDEELPLTESELDYYARPTTRDVPMERMSNLITMQLISLFQIYATLEQIFDNDGLKRQTIVSNLPTHVQKSLIEELTSLSPQSTSFAELTKNLPADELQALFKTSINSFMINENLKTVKQDLKLTKIENAALSFKNDFSPAFKHIFHRYKTRNNLNYKFLIEMAHLFQTSSLSTVDLEPLIKKLNRHINNQNFSCLSSVLSLTLLQRQNHRYVENESMFYEFIRSCLISHNRGIFDICLNKLNLDYLSLKRIGKPRRTEPLVKSITRGSNMFSYTFSLRTYMVALKGLRNFSYSESQVKRAVKKVLLSLKTVGDETRVLHRLRPRAQRTYNVVFKTIPREALQVIVDLAMDYRDSALLKWCVIGLKRSGVLSEEMYIEVTQRIQSIAKEIQDLELHELVEKVREL